jgi:NAD dependent epimerase/dehydratase family enzyme
MIKRASQKVLVAGGGGFLGGAIVKLLVERGDRVRSFSRSYYPELASVGVEQFQGDISDKTSLLLPALSIRFQGLSIQVRQALSLTEPTWKGWMSRFLIQISFMLIIQEQKQLPNSILSRLQEMV